jgi:hypothetical protein
MPRQFSVVLSLAAEQHAKRIMLRFCWSSHDPETKIINTKIRYYSIWLFLFLIPSSTASDCLRVFIAVAHNFVHLSFPAGFQSP